jgi:hypothetical protein
MKVLKSLRKINHLVIHCAAGNLNESSENVHHFFTKILKWQFDGYHVFIEAKPRIRKDGAMPKPEDKDYNSGVRRLISDDHYSNGIKKHGFMTNENTVHVCCAGGLLMENGKVIKDKKGFFVPIDNRTDYQKEMLESVVKWYLTTYPDIKILGHNQISPDKKTCPNYSVPKWAESVGIPSDRVYDKDNFNVLKVMKY